MLLEKTSDFARVFQHRVETFVENRKLTIKVHTLNFFSEIFKINLLVILETENHWYPNLFEFCGYYYYYSLFLHSAPAAAVFEIIIFYYFYFLQKMLILAFETIRYEYIMEKITAVMSISNEWLIRTEWDQRDKRFCFQLSCYLKLSSSMRD